jgi:hypothetical protein
MEDNTDWKNLPFDHSGRWQKKIDSIMNPGTKITWPQFVAEMIIYWRTRFIKDYQDITIGPDWYKPIMKHVRDLNQQSTVICNYFPHPDDEPMVTVAFKNWFRKNRPMKIGRFRKTRIKPNGSLNITQDEKDVIYGVQSELDRLIKQRSIISSDVKKRPAPSNDTVQYDTTGPQRKNKNNLRYLLDLEKKMSGDTNG